MGASNGDTTAVLTNDHRALRATWLVAATAAEIGVVPRSVLLLGDAWALARDPRAGTVLAFADRCPHRLAPLSAGAIEGDGTWRCAYHGWGFAPGGRCVAIPALGPDATISPRAIATRPAAVAEHLGLVWLAVDPPVAPLPDVPEWDAPGFERGELTPSTARAGAGLLLDNFCDVAHFPFVHARTFGAAEAPEVAPFSVERSGWTATSVSEHEFTNREDPGVARGERPLVQRRRMTLRYAAPLAASLRIDYLDAGGTNVVLFAVQPETADRVRIYTTLLRDDLAGDDAWREAIAYEQAVLDEDLRIQSAYRSLVLPLDVTVEVHTRADRLTVEVRRILADLVAAVSPGPGPAA